MRILFLLLILACPLKANDYDPAVLLKSATALEDQKKHAEAVDVYIKAYYASYPTKEIQDALFSAFQRLLSELMEAKNYADVLKQAKRADSFFPSSFDFMRFYMYVNFEQENYNSCIFHASQLLEIFGSSDTVKSDEIRFFMAQSYHKLKAYRLVLETLEKVSPNSPDKRSIHVLKGDSLYHRGSLEEATKEFQAAQALQKTEDIEKILAKIAKEKPIEAGYAASAPTPHFILKSKPENLNKTTSAMSFMLESIYLDLASTLQFYPESPITVIVYEGNNPLQARLQNPSWAAGIYDGEIRIPDGELKKPAYELETLLRHETMHLFLDNLTRNSIPTWFNEGLAQYYEKPFMTEEGEGKFNRRPDAPLPKGFKELVTDALSKDKTLDMPTLSGSFLKLDANGARLAYAQSLMMAKYFVEYWGTWKLRRLLQDMYSGNRFEVAFKMETGLSQADFLISWKQYQKGQWKL